MSTRRRTAQRRAIFKQMLARARELGATGVPTREIYTEVALLRDDLIDASRQGLVIRPITAVTSAQEDQHAEHEPEREDPHV